MKTGDRCLLTFHGRTVPAHVMFASENERSLMLGFSALLGGYLAQMPVLLDERGDYHDLITNNVVIVEPVSEAVWAERFAEQDQ